jgi:hypothetical protein
MEVPVRAVDGPTVLTARELLRVEVKIEAADGAAV